MANDSLLQVRIDTRTKARAAKLFKRMGLSTSDGVRLLLHQALEAKSIPSIPNAETRKALEDARAGDGEHVRRADLKNRILGDT